MLHLKNKTALDSFHVPAMSTLCLFLCKCDGIVPGNCVVLPASHRISLSCHLVARIWKCGLGLHSHSMAIIGNFNGVYIEQTLKYMLDKTNGIFNEFLPEQRK